MTKAKTGTEDTIHFSDLLNSPEDRETEQDRVRRFLAKINDPTKWLYGSEARDEYLLRDNNSNPRYGHLARKAFVYYAKEHYNPHTISINNEIHIRILIKLLIEYKVLGRVRDYDWEIIDNHLAKSIGNILDLNIPYDQARLDRGIRHEFRSPFHGLDLESVS